MSTLLKNYGMQTYKTPKGFKYPWAIQAWEEHDAMIWHKNEYTLSSDIQDYARANDKEKQDIDNVMKLFIQNDVMAGTGYITMLRIFKPTEIQLMLSKFLDREGTHVFNYANFAETIGLPDSVFTEFLEVPVMSTKNEYLEKAKVHKYEDYKAMGMSDAQVDKEFRRAVARMVAVYAAGLEGTSLMAQFAMLLAYQFQNKYKGLCDIVTWSIRDEMQHLKWNATLFRTFIAENQDIWDDALKFDIYEAMRELVAHEHALIDYINPQHISNESLKRYVEYMADNALNELGMKRNWQTTVNPLPFMDDAVGEILVDFFSNTVTEYTKDVEGSWDQIVYEHWKD